MLDGYMISVKICVSYLYIYMLYVITTYDNCTEPNRTNTILINMQVTLKVAEN